MVRRREGGPDENGLSRPAESHDSLQRGAKRSNRRPGMTGEPVRSFRSTIADVRPVAARRDEGHLPAGKRRHSRLVATHEAGHFRDIIATNALYRPGPSKAAWSMTTSKSSTAPQDAGVQTSGDEGDPGRDPRRDGLPGAGDADLEPAGRDQAVQRIYLHQGHQQEEVAADRQVPRRIPGRCQSAAVQERCGGAVRADRESLPATASTSRTRRRMPWSPT